MRNKTTVSLLLVLLLALSIEGSATSINISTPDVTISLWTSIMGPHISVVTSLHDRDDHSRGNIGNNNGNTGSSTNGNSGGINNGNQGNSNNLGTQSDSNSKQDSIVIDPNGQSGSIDNGQNGNTDGASANQNNGNEYTSTVTFHSTSDSSSVSDETAFINSNGGGGPASIFGLNDCDRAKNWWFPFLASGNQTLKSRAEYYFGIIMWRDQQNTFDSWYQTQCQGKPFKETPADKIVW
jgi:hypothetical protein